MSDQYVGEIRMFSGDYAPEGWALCNGALLPITENEILYTLLGTAYGGDGRVSFGLPDLRGRVPIHRAPNYPVGQTGGAEQVTLVSANLPVHTHVAQANNDATQPQTGSPENAYWGVSSITNYQPGGPNLTMNAEAVSSVGGNQAHDNVMPGAVVNFIIATQGLFPFQG